MKKSASLTLVALLLQGVASPVMATNYSPQAIRGQIHRVVVGIKDNTDLAQRLRASVKQDATGRTPISAESCNRFRACGTPYDLLQWYRDDTGDASKTYEQLIEYIAHGLEVGKAPADGQWWMYCKTGAGGALSPMLKNCVARKFHKGEIVLIDKKTGQIKFAGDCNNPVVKKDIPDQCVYQHVYLKKDDVIHKYWMGPHAYPEGDCVPAVQKEGSTDWSNNLVDECPDVCDGSKPLDELSKLRHWPSTARVWSTQTVSFTAEQAGWYVFRNRVEVLTSKSEDVLCVVHADGSRTMSKFMPGISYWHDHAYIVYGNTPPITNWKGGVVSPWRSSATGEIEQ